ncbi:hypothetical protein [Nocardioides xinjiangensis]|uniref:hypothetical protein n=1 Tax=Nocardioides xinjiangensis TaxID=2817376 RepID=UPI001B317954|nr:hypothetical protein [Nocardioides sp. SYSU D00778]
MMLLHLGALHPYEQLLTLLLAFGPFAVLGLVIWRRRGEDVRADGADDGAAGGPESDGAADAAGPTAEEREPLS